MVEILFLIVCLMIYLVSFIYGSITIIATVVAVGSAFTLGANMFFVLGLTATLTLIRIKKSRIKDEF